MNDPIHGHSETFMQICQNHFEDFDFMKDLVGKLHKKDGSNLSFEEIIEKVSKKGDRYMMKYIGEF